MNYNDQILENKAFNFVKQLMYNIALSLCIMLIGVLLMVYGLGFKLYEVMSGSEEPYLPVGCMAIVKAQDDYKVGDIITFEQGTRNPKMMVTHRLIAIYEENGKTIYVCHGDNVEPADPNATEDTVNWEHDSKYVQDFINNNGGKLPSTTTVTGYPKNIQKVESDKVEGKVVNHIDNLGSIVTFIKNHYVLVIGIVAGIWCVSSVLQNEIEMKKQRRLM